MKNLEVDDGEVVNIDELTEKARETIQPSLFDLGVVSQVGYGIPPVDVMMTEDDKEFSGQIKSTIGKGMTQETIGFVGDMMGILKGLYNMSDLQWEELSQRIKDPTVQPKVRGLLEAFLDGFSEIEELNLPPGLGMTSEAADKMLTEMGWDPVSKANTPEKKEILETIKLGSQVISPAPTGAAVDVVKKVGKTVKGLDDAKKLFKAPETVYHGTDAKFDTFKNSKGGIYFTDNPEQAKKFGKNMKEVSLNLKNPYIIDDFKFDSGFGEKFEIWKNKVKRMLGVKNYDDQTMKSNAWSVQPETIQRLKDKGYDGILIPSNVSSSKDNRYIVFDPSQIQIKGK